MHGTLFSPNLLSYTLSCVHFISIRAILHNEMAFPDPESFRPERFLTIGPSDMNNPFPEAVFGFGRRICPGRYMARSAMWIAIASILATYEISKALDEKGHEVEPIDEYTSGIIS